MSMHLKIRMTVLQPLNGFTQSSAWELFMASLWNQAFLTCWKGNTIKGNSNCAIILCESHPVPCGAEWNFASGILHSGYFSSVFHSSLITVTTEAIEVCGKYWRKYYTCKCMPLVAVLHLNCTSLCLKKNAVISFMSSAILLYPCVVAVFIPLTFVIFLVVQSLGHEAH